MSKLGRFIGGFALTTLDNLQKREAFDRETQRDELLAKLRMEQEKELFEYKDLLDRKKPDARLSSENPTTGKITLRNSYGDEVKQIDMSAADKAKYDYELKKQSLDLQNIESQIKSRSIDDARQERSTNAYIASLSRRGGEGGGADGTDDPEALEYDRADALIQRYGHEVGEAVKSGNISQGAIRAAALALIKKNQTGSGAQQDFITFLNRYRTGRAKTDQAKRSLDSTE